MSIYLDYQATTPLDPVVADAMAPYWEDQYGNPHSQHRHGWQAAAGFDKARTAVAALVGAPAAWTIFTSGATEANNLALKGAMQAAPPGRRRLVTVATEHSCVLESARWLEQQGFELTVLNVEPSGLLDMEALDSALADDVALVSVMAVNNEIGVIQPLAEIGRRVRNAGALFHSDAAQAFGKMPLDVEAMSLDLLSVSGHKIYGPKGIGALLLRPGTRLAPQMHGGGQEGDGLRSGTLAPALIAGLGRAAEQAASLMAEDSRQARNFFDLMLSLLPKPFQVNGDTERRLHANLNVTFPGIDSARLLMDARRLSISSGAACAGSAGRKSHVLAALGLSDAEMRGTLRMGWGRFTVEADIREAASMIADAVSRQRQVAA
ncbi:cysteine desulfurase family protein [Pacificimonas flava]|uniref:Cysteine desulfurase n=1 Tax=Pacificimonas flava TaxID=1234595 RepID=M2U8K7_9SPHN|nr:cysteine desulfurase family protein [Pacificimonas flava]EMD84302.1 putative cysteine desulfurase [Pacificimonas flava]MBB5279822.1 cysteine desulfurase [Pacificimonas flava]